MITTLSSKCRSRVSNVEEGRRRRSHPAADAFRPKDCPIF
jgi:hypothetical protein